MNFGCGEMFGKNCSPPTTLMLLNNDQFPKLSEVGVGHLFLDVSNVVLVQVDAVQDGFKVLAAVHLANVNVGLALVHEVRGVVPLVVAELLFVVKDLVDFQVYVPAAHGGLAFKKYYAFHKYRF